MDNRRHLLHLWILGTLVMMVTSGTLAGALLRQWSEGTNLPQAGMGGSPILIGSAAVLMLGLSGLWFRNGVLLWKAARPR